MILTSSAFSEGDWIPKKYSARGEDLSPDLHIENIDENTESLIITFDDDSHPLFPGYNHWIMWNVPPKTDIQSGIPKAETVGSLGNAVQGIAYGKHCYKGPKPPFKSIHNYTFTVFALDTKLQLNSSATREDVLKATNGHILEKATLTGKFQSHRAE